MPSKSPTLSSKPSFPSSSLATRSSPQSMQIPTSSEQASESTTLVRAPSPAGDVTGAHTKFVTEGAIEDTGVLHWALFCTLLLLLLLRIGVGGLAFVIICTLFSFLLPNFLGTINKEGDRGVRRRSFIISPSRSSSSDSSNSKRAPKIEATETPSWKSSTVRWAEERHEQVLLSPPMKPLSPSKERQELPKESVLSPVATSAQTRDDPNGAASSTHSDMPAKSELTNRESQGPEVMLIDMSATVSPPKIALAFDVGTTFSGISYSIQTSDDTTAIKGVVKAFGQEQGTGDSKIPTILYYDQQGKVCAIGVEAMAVGIEKAARDGKWFKAEWFKLHLRSQVGNGNNLTGKIPRLPPGKTVVDVLADYLHYLFNCAESHIQQTHPNEAGVWAAHRDEIHFVLSHPNGWEGKEQSQMRLAATKARLIPDTLIGKSRVSFVTEGESSLHLAIGHEALSQNEEVKGIIIVDAGGGTIDISTYGRNDNKDGKKTFEEISAAECHYSGSTFVTMKARLFLEEFLKGSRFQSDIDKITRCFDQTVKITFKDINELQYIKFGSTNDNDPSHAIHRGRLQLPGTTVAKFFQPSVDSIVKSLQHLQRSAHGKITHIILVGGFSANDWLFNRVRTSVAGQGLTVIRPDNQISETALNGPISSYVEHYVRTRVVKVTYGEFASTPFDYTSLKHQLRAKSCYTDIEGTKLIPRAFHIILSKNTQVSETKEFRQAFCQLWEVRAARQSLNADVWCYRGSLENPGWKDVDTANYTKLCTLTTALHHLPVQTLRNPSGKTYYRIDFEVVLLPGLTELHAQLAWQENGKEKRSRAELVYDYET